MGVYDDSKGGPGAVYLDGADTSGDGWQRDAPLITPEQIRIKHLWGISLVSAQPDGVTGVPMVMTPEIIRDIQDDVIADLELHTGLVIFPTQIVEKQPFDIHEYQSFGYFRLMKRPAMSIEKISVCPSNDIDVYDLPLDWIETGNLHRGQVNIVPLTLALARNGAVNSSQPGGGAAYLSIFGYRNWIPAFWKITYTAGFPSGKVPKVWNNLIGIVTAMEVLSMLASTYAKTQGGSLSIDGFSQSSSGPGPEIYTKRMEQLDEKRKTLIKKLKALYGTTLFTGNV